MSSNEPTYPANFYARLFGVTERRVQQLAKEGHIPKAGRGEYPLLGTVKGYVAFLQESLRGGGESKDTRTALQEEKVKLTRAQREKIDIEIDKVTGELIPQDEYYLELSTTLKTVSATLSSLSDVLERELQLSPETLERIDDITDALRDDIADQITEAIDRNDA